MDNECLEYIKGRMLAYSKKRPTPQTMATMYDECKAHCENAGIIGPAYHDLWRAAALELHTLRPGQQSVNSR